MGSALIASTIVSKSLVVCTVVIVVVATRCPAVIPITVLALPAPIYNVALLLLILNAFELRDDWLALIPVIPAALICAIT